MSHEVPSSLPGPRKGDTLAIAGDYQHRALRDGPRIQRYWHASKLELLDWIFPVAPGEAVVDVGCGSGVFADRLVQHGATVLGVDSNPDAIRYATKTFAGPQSRFIKGLLDELDIKKASFDVATCLEIVEHVYPEQVDKLLTNLYYILKPGGRLLVTTPNYHGTWPLVEFLADHLGSTAKMDTDQHVTHFHRQLLQRHVEKAGFHVKTIRTYCTFAPFVAAFWWGAGCYVDRLERALNLPFGNILIMVATRPEGFEGGDRE